MFQPRFRRLTTLLSLAAYLAVSTLGGLLHHHSHGHAAHEHLAQGHGCAEHEHVCGEHADHGHGEHDDHEHGFSTADHQDHDHDDCVVCRGLGQRPLAVESPRFDHVSALSVWLAIAAESIAPAEQARTTHSRAPPVIA